MTDGAAGAASETQQRGESHGETGQCGESPAATGRHGEPASETGQRGDPFDDALALANGVRGAMTGNGRSGRGDGGGPGPADDARASGPDHPSLSGNHSSSSRDSLGNHAPSPHGSPSGAKGSEGSELP